VPPPLGYFERILIDNAIFALPVATVGYAAEQGNIMLGDMGEKPLIEKDGCILSRCISVSKAQAHFTEILDEPIMFQTMLLGGGMVVDKLFLSLKVVEHVIFEDIQQGFDDSSISKCLAGTAQILDQIQDDLVLVVDESDTDVQTGIPCIKLSHASP
jgi:hypothetical protein